MSVQTDRVDAAQLAHLYAIDQLETTAALEKEALDLWMRAIQSEGRDADATKRFHGGYLKTAQKCRAARDRAETTERALVAALGELAGAGRG